MKRTPIFKTPDTRYQIPDTSPGSRDPRLIWRCRRGIREMDILLQRFVENHYDNLNTEEKRSFEQLLEEADLDIMSWIMGKSTPPSAELKHIIQLIRK